MTAPAVERHVSRYTVCSSHLASIHFRDIFEIEEGDQVAKVLADVPLAKDMPKGGPRVSLRRKVQAMSTASFILLNAFNMSYGVQRSAAPAQLRLAARFRHGAMATDSWKCSARRVHMLDDAEEEARRRTPWHLPWCPAAAAHHPTSACERLGDDARAAMTVMLVWTELLMLLSAVLHAVKHLSTLRAARTDASWTTQNWQSVARGFESLAGLATVSALRVLPVLKTAPAELHRSYKVRRGRLTEDDGHYSAADQLSTLAWALRSVCWLVLLAFAGLAALYLKMCSLKHVLALPVVSWSPRQWAAFVGFANQIASLIPMRKLRKEAFLFFVFTGEDAELQPSELEAMRQFNAMLHMKIWQSCTAPRAASAKPVGLGDGERIEARWPSWLDAFAAALTITSADLQKIVIEEQHAKAE